MTVGFRKRIGFFGGLARLNLSRGGISVSAGPPGASIGVDLSGRRKHPRMTLGIPGSGLYYQTDLKGKTQPEQVDSPPPPPAARPASSWMARALIALFIRR